MKKNRISYAVAYALYGKELENFNTNQSVDASSIIDLKFARYLSFYKKIKTKG